MNALVTVVVPTYNRDYVLGRALDSVFAQTYQNFEIMVVDDGSRDGTRALIKERYGHDSRVRYTYQENGGVAAARNRGLEQSKGDYIALLDSDDVWKPWKLELQIRALAHQPGVGMIWTDMEAIDTSGQMFDPAYLRKMYSAYRWFSPKDLFDQISPITETWPDAPSDVRQASVHCGEIYSQMIMGSLVHTSTVLFTRERFEKVGLFNEALRPLGEDYDYHLRTCRVGRVAFVNAASIQYQTGMSDRLTRPEYSIHVANNFLKTVSEAVKNDRKRIHLPQGMINDVLCEAHEWIGEIAVEQGDRATASRHLFKALMRKPLHMRTAGLLALSLLPQWLSARSRQAYASAKYILGASHRG